MKAKCLIFAVVFFLAVIQYGCTKGKTGFNKTMPFEIDSLNTKILKNGHDTIPIHFNSNQVYVLVAGRNKHFGVGAFTYLNGLTYSLGKHDKLTIVGFSDMSNAEFSDLSDLSHVLPVYWFFPAQNEAVDYCLSIKEATPNAEIQTYVINKGKVVYTTNAHDREAFKAVGDTLWKILARYPNKGGYRKV
jgi:hypothetical protein